MLYALGLKEGITADEIAASSARPKNTLSRAVNALLAKRHAHPRRGRQATAGVSGSI